MSTRLALPFLVLVAAACDEASTNPAPPSPRPGLAPADPAKPGPYAVGVTTITVRNGDRELPIEVWYPADEGSGEEVVDYPVLIGTLEIAAIPSLLHARRDAAVALEGAPHPAVVFSHGYSGMRVQSVYLGEHLASHGFVVAAPDHVGNTLSDVGTVPSGVSAGQRPVDLSRTLDAVLEASDTFPGLLFLAADPARVGVVGHSFGGFTALRVAGAELDASYVAAQCPAHEGEFICEGWDATIPQRQRDERFVAALVQSPGDAFTFGEAGEGYRAIDVPLMIQAGTHDEVNPPAREQEPMFDAAPAPASLVEIEGAGHFSFSDVCVLTDALGIEIDQLSDGCGDDDAPPAEAHARMNTYATAFLQRYVAKEEVSASPLDAGPGKGIARLDAK